MSNNWKKHVAKVMRAHPNYSLKEALEEASRTYKRNEKAKKRLGFF